jgi:hypothetical protein
LTNLRRRAGLRLLAKVICASCELSSAGQQALESHSRPLTAPAHIEVSADVLSSLRSKELGCEGFGSFLGGVIEISTRARLREEVGRKLSGSEARVMQAPEEERTRRVASIAASLWLTSLTADVMSDVSSEDLLAGFASLNELDPACLSYVDRPGRRACLGWPDVEVKTGASTTAGGGDATRPGAGRTPPCDRPAAKPELSEPA